MKPLLLISTIFLLMTISCSTEDKSITKTPTLKDFQAGLKADMNYSALVERFGEPSKDIGSGIHIYVYALADATEIWIGLTDKIHYAKQVDEQGTVLLTLI